MLEPRRKPLGEGAAQAAPTAPHATPHDVGEDGGRRSGPERFWSRGPVRIAFWVALLVSGVAHCALVPIDVSQAFRIEDVDGEAAIPVDLLPQEEAPPASASAPSEGVSASGSVEPAPVPQRRRPVRDAGSDRDGSRVDGSAEVTPEGGNASPPPSDVTGPRDPQAIVGAAGAVQADVVLVLLLVNAEVIRTNVVGKQMGYLLRGIPQWDDFMSGTDIDPVRDVDWVMISGPSLVNTGRDVVLVRYSTTDQIVDRAVDVVSRKYPLGGAIDAGVPGVPAFLARADRAERVILRPQSHVLAVVPPSVAERIARQLVTSRVPAHVRPGEAVYLRLVNPHHPMPEIPETITELRLRVLPRPDQGADVVIDGDTKDPDTASQDAQEVARIFRRHDDALTSLLTHGVLDHVDVKTEGPMIEARIAVSLEQVETLVALVGGFLGLEAPPSLAPVPTSK